MEIEGTFDLGPLNQGCLDNTTYDLLKFSMEEFWNDGALDMIVRAGGKRLKLDEVKLLMDYYEDHRDVEEVSSQPIVFQLNQNYLNPFNPETEMSFSLPERASVSLTVYNVFGQKVRELIEATLPAGSYRVTWDGTNDQGNRLASGVYFCCLSAGENASTQKMILMK